MIWPLKKRERPDTPEVQAAHAARERAERTMDAVRLRTSEVDTYYTNLRERRLQNNFGAALQAAMGQK